MKIRNHISYGGKPPVAKPWLVKTATVAKVPSHGFAASADRKKPKSVPAAVAREAIRKGRPRQKPEPTEANLLGWLEGFAIRGERCPTRTVIAQTFGQLANLRILDLARAGKLTIEVGGRNWRVITIKGRKTMGLPCGRKPYLRIDKDGLWRRRGTEWVRG